MLLAMVYMLLLMVASLSAVPHGHAEALPAEPQSSLSCGKHFSLRGSSCYRYFGQGWGFHQARKLCARHKASLVSLIAAEEEKFVVQLAENNTSFWIGLNDEDGPTFFHKEGVFKWSDGQPFGEVGSYQNWKYGEPNNRKHLDCVKVDYAGWAMALGGCGGTKLPFVCQKRACPVGLEWGGSDCVVVHDTSQGPSSLRAPTQQGRLFAVWMITASVFLVVIVCYLYRTRGAHPPHDDSLS